MAGQLRLLVVRASQEARHALADVAEIDGARGQQRIVDLRGSSARRSITSRHAQPADSPPPIAS